MSDKPKGVPDDASVYAVASDGKYTIYMTPEYKWHVLRYAEPWPAFDARPPDNLHTALAYEVDELRTKNEALRSMLLEAYDEFARGAQPKVPLPGHWTFRYYQQERKDATGT